MKKTIKSAVKKGLKCAGVDYSKIRGHQENILYQNVLFGALSVKKPINIFQVGANDGKYNDPIYKFVKENRENTRIILTEPIIKVIPYLKNNYDYHPSSEVYNTAIGSSCESKLKLYGIKEEYWDDINVEYGDNWPDYRVPTGVTTSNRDRMLNWVSNNVEVPNSSRAIEVYDVNVQTPDHVLEQSNLMQEIDLLQVDTEGMDNEIVYSFFDCNIYPNIINIEKKHLTSDEIKEYDRRLRSLDYKIIDYDSEHRLCISI